MIKLWLPLNKDERNIGLGSGFPKNSGVTFTTGGPVGNYASFAPTNKFIVLPKDALTGMTDYCTVCFWMKLDAFGPAWQTVFAMLRSSQAWTGNVFTFIRNNNTSAFTFSISNGSSSTQASLLTDNLSLNTWYHFACVYKPGLMMLYQNGSLLRTYSTTIKPCFSAITHAALGIESNTSFSSIYYQHRGGISDVRVYDHELKDWEIKKIYNCLAYEMEGKLHLEGTENINLSRNLSTTAYNGANGKYGYNDASNLKKESVVIDGIECDKVSIRSGNTAVYPYVFFSPLHPTSGAWKTVSFDYYPTKQNKLIPYTYGGNGNVKWTSNYSTTGSATNAASTTIPVNLNEWNHVELSIQGTTSATTGWGYFRIGTAKYTGSTGDYWLFKHSQIEEKDHATPYSLQSRVEMLADMSGIDNQTTMYNITQSGSSLYFNGTNSAIKIPLYDMIKGGTWTINIWFYRPNGQFGSKAWETLIGGPSGFEFSSKRSTGTSPIIVAYSWGQNSSGGASYEYDRWNMVTMVRTPSEFKFYLNGEVAYTTTTVGSMPSGDYFIGAWKTSAQQNFKGYIKRFSVYKKELTAEDVKNLYLNGE